MEISEGRGDLEPARGHVSHWRWLGEEKSKNQTLPNSWCWVGLAQNGVCCGGEVFPAEADGWTGAPGLGWGCQLYHPPVFYHILGENSSPCPPS